MYYKRIFLILLSFSFFFLKIVKSESGNINFYFSNTELEFENENTIKILKEGEGLGGIYSVNIDINSDGFVSFEELQYSTGREFYLLMYNLDEYLINNFHKIDSDNNGLLSNIEFNDFKKSIRSTDIESSKVKKSKVKKSKVKKSKVKKSKAKKSKVKKSKAKKSKAKKSKAKKSKANKSKAKKSKESKFKNTLSSYRRVKLFSKYDFDQNNLLTIDEIDLMDDENVKFFIKYFEDIDSNIDGIISRKEFEGFIIN